MRKIAVPAILALVLMPFMPVVVMADPVVGARVSTQDRAVTMTEAMTAELLRSVSPVHTERVITSDEMSPELLRDLLVTTLVKTESISSGEDSGIKVRGMSGLEYVVIVKKSQKLLMFATSFPFKSGVNYAAKAVAVARANDNLILLRYAIPENNQGYLWIDYWITYDFGLTPKSVLDTARWFEKIATEGTQTFVGSLLK